jgi:hypothetical protein
MSEKAGDGQSGGVNISGSVGVVRGNIVGHDMNMSTPSTPSLDDALRALVEVIAAAPPETGNTSC